MHAKPSVCRKTRKKIQANLRNHGKIMQGTTYDSRVVAKKGQPGNTKPNFCISASSFCLQFSNIPTVCVICHN